MNTNIRWWLCLLLCLFMVNGTSAQDKSEPVIKQFYNADGAPVYKLWFFVNRIGFRYQGDSEVSRRLDENQEEQVILMYDNGGVRTPLHFLVRIALENGPPASAAMTKEHEIRGLTVWMEIVEDDDEVASFKRRAEDITVIKNADVSATMEPFTFRGVTFTPGVRYHPLHDLAGTAYSVRMDGLSFALTYEP